MKKNSPLSDMMKKNVIKDVVETTIFKMETRQQ